jgi:hypothetical protein
VRRVLDLRGLPLAYVLVALAYVGLRLAAYLPSAIRTFPDSGVYLAVAEEPLLSAEFLAGGGQWTVPLLYKVLPDSDAARAAGQLTISVGCWLALAAITAWCVQRHNLRLAAFCLVLLFSLSVEITQWDPIILTESLTLSLTAVVLAAWLALARAPGVWTVAAVLGATLLWSFARDDNAWVSLFAVPFVLGWGAFRGDRRPRIVVASGLVAIFVVHALSLNVASAQARWEFLLLSIIGNRVLTDEDQLDYFRAHGMPVPDRLQPLAGEPIGLARFRPALEDPAFERFRAWVVDDGRDTLATYLLTHPHRALSPVGRDAETLFASGTPGSGPSSNDPVAAYRAEGTEPLLPSPLAAVIYPPSVAALLVWLGVLIACAVWLARRGAARPIWLVPAIALLLQVPHAAMVWHADPNDIPRHAVEVGVMAHLSLLLLSIMLIDAALGLRRGDAGESVSAPRRP